MLASAASKNGGLFDQVVGDLQKLRRHLEAERLGSLGDW